MKSISRAQFFRGDWHGKRPVLRPPWALSEPFFSDTCDGCGNCVTACEEEIIFISYRKLPQLNFSQGGCTFCNKCTEVCEAGALNRFHEPGERPWPLVAVISNMCLAKRGTSCVRCVEECEHNAITARLALGGRSKMQINPQTCTGCGMCISTCPVEALTLENLA
ncbi:MAG: ferredoxin-type protein NapF [Gammaproteobacteria bacterium]|nr:ferredoxin-type protein NapF [Gammaproteobacteria bacterium]